MKDILLEIIVYRFGFNVIYLYRVFSKYSTFMMSRAKY